MTAEPSYRNASIDALRAIAALCVVWVHAGEAFLPVAGSGRWLYDAAIGVNAGRVGVTIFFLVSGFVIPSSLDRDGPRLAVVSAFAIRRVFRLYPAYWLSVPVAAIVSWIAYGLAPDPAIVAVNLTMLQDAFGVPSMQWVYWTLQTELIFYVLCAVLFVAGCLRSNAAVALASLLLLAAFLAGFTTPAAGTWLADWQPHRLAGNLSLMFLGTLMRRWHDGGLSEAASRLASALVTAFWLAGASLIVGDPSYSIALTTFIAGAFLIRSPAQLLVSIGRASYSLYLFHAVLVRLLAFLIGRGWLAGGPLLLYVVAGGLLSMLLAEGLYRRVELPMIALGNRIAMPGRNSVVPSSP